MSMHKILSLAVVAGAFALYGAPANAESLPEIVNQQISDRVVPSYPVSNVAASASRGHDESLVHLQYEQIPH